MKITDPNLITSSDELCPPFVENDTEQNWLNRAEKALKGGQYEEAITYSDKAIEIDPKSAKAWNNRGIALVKLGNNEEAIQSFDRVIELNPQFAESWYNKGSTLKSLGKYEEALQSYNKAIELNPQDADFCNGKGVTLVKIGKYEEALQSYNKAIELNPRDSNFWNNKGEVLTQQGKFEEAIQAFHKAIEINPRFAEAWNNKGQTFYNLGNYEEAVQSYDKAIMINPQEADFWNNKGAAFSQLGKYEKAIQSYSQAIQIDNEKSSNVAKAWYNKGLVLAKLGKYNESLESFNKAIEIDPNDVNAWYGKIFTFNALGLISNAKEASNKVSNIKSENYSDWEVRFTLNYPLSEISIKETDGLKFDTRAHPLGVELKGFAITISAASEQEARILAEGKANRIFSYLSSIHNRSIAGYFSGMTEIKPKGEVKKGIMTTRVHGIIHNPLDLDFSLLKDLFEFRDEKLLRQLGHYSMGLKATDVISKYREFYQVIENEREKIDISNIPPSQSIESIDGETIQKVIRNLSSHPVLSKNVKQASIAKALLGRPYIEISNPKDKGLVEEYLKVVQEEAQKILTAKLGALGLSG